MNVIRFKLRIIYKMFTLVTEKHKFFRIKRGMTAGEVEQKLCVPVQGKLFVGKIMETDEKFKVYFALPGDTYRTVALKFRVNEDELKKINSDRIVYPTRRLFIPE